MKKTIAAVFIAMLLAGYGAESSSRAYSRVRSANPRAETPRFEDFPVPEQFKGKPASGKARDPRSPKVPNGDQ